MAIAVQGGTGTFDDEHQLVLRLGAEANHQKQGTHHLQESFDFHAL
jgi:hypothetical protein